MACGLHDARSRFYKRCSTSELSQFALQRGLLDSTSSHREQLIDLLNQADTNVSFKFLELPAELRNKIYRLTMQDHEPFYNGRVSNPHPLNQVSKSVRSEALPNFYEFCRFPVFEPRMTTDRNTAPMPWVHDFSPEVIGSLRSLVVTREASYRPDRNACRISDIGIAIDLHNYKYDIWLGSYWCMACHLQPLDRYRTKLLTNDQIHVGVDAMKRVLDQAYEQQTGTAFRLTRELILELAQAAFEDADP